MFHVFGPIFFSVDSCVSLLKFQASKASCPLDLLAAESLGTRLVSICSFSEQLLSKNQLVNVVKYIF